MHELFTKVLSKRDLSRAGDLFSVADYEIVNDLTQVVSLSKYLFYVRLVSRMRGNMKHFYGNYYQTKLVSLT